MGQYDDMPPPPMPAPVDSGFSTWPPPHWGMTPAIAQALAPPPMPGDQPGLAGIPASALDAAAAAPPPPPPGTPIVSIGDPTGSAPPPAPAPALPQSGTNPDQPPGFGTPAWMQAGQPPSGSLPPMNPDQPDAISGAGFPGSVAESDHDKITDLDGDRVKSAEYYAKHPLDNPNNVEAQTGLNALLEDEFHDLQKKHEVAGQLDAATKQLAELTHQHEIARQNYQTRLDADAAATKQANQVNADAMKLAQQQIDPERWWNTRSTGQKIAGYIAAIAGGLASPQFGGRNIGLEQINKAIDQDTEAQKANLANAWKGIEIRKGAVSDLFERNRNTFQAAETFRLASYDMVEKQLAIEQQNYDPRGTTYLAIEATRRGLRDQRANAFESLRRNAFEEYIKAGDLATKKYDAETRRAAEEAKANKGRGGAGAGSGTNPAYTVPTGFFDPFTGSPVMGKRQIGGKGEDAKERNTVSAQMATYGHVQDYWAQLAAIGAKIDHHKSLGESVWSKFKSTDASEYDAAKEALTVYLTKELGDKLTQGQLEAQAHRIPDRTTILESRDVGKQIRDAQSDADRDFARDMNLVGIDGETIVRSAQSMRKPPPIPDEGDQADAALQAAGKSTSGTAKKDAQQALSSAEKRLKTDRDEAAQRHFDIANALALPPALQTIDAGTVNSNLQGKAELLNRAATDYAAIAKKFHTETTDMSYLKGRKEAGDIAAATKANNAKLGARAKEVLQMKQQYDALHAEIAKQEPWIFQLNDRKAAPKPAGMGDVRKDVPRDD